MCLKPCTLTNSTPASLARDISHFLAFESDKIPLFLLLNIKPLDPVISFKSVNISIVLSSQTRKDNESKEIIKYTNYKEWAEAKGYSKPDVKFKQVLEDVDFTNSRRSQAKQVLNNLGLDDIKISIRQTDSRRHCGINIQPDGSSIITEYVLNSQDDRSDVYQTKTLFHEAYHAMGHNRQIDIRSMDYGSIRWLDIEETFAETSSHYAIFQGKRLYLPASAKLWKIYHPKGPYTSGSEIHNLTPSAYGGLTYDIKGNPAPHVYLIDTGVKGRVAIYAGPETGAVIS